MEQIEAINMSGYYPHRFNFDIDNSSRTIKYHRLLQAQVMYAIIKLYENKKGKLSVVWFSDNPEILPHKDISEILGLIYNQNFQGRNTNFVKLFTVLKHSIINSIEPNRYRIRNCHIYLFSKNDYDLSNQIREFEYDMRKHNIVIKSHFYDCRENSLISSLNKDIERGLNDTIFALKPLRFYYDDKQFSLYIS